MSVDPNDDDVIVYGDGSDDDTSENKGYYSATRIVISDDKVYHVDLATGDVEEVN